MFRGATPDAWVYQRIWWQTYDPDAVSDAGPVGPWASPADARKREPGSNDLGR